MPSIYSTYDINSAWLIQDYILVNGIHAHIEVDHGSDPIADAAGKRVFTVCVAGDHMVHARALAKTFETKVLRLYRKGGYANH